MDIEWIRSGLNSISGFFAAPSLGRPVSPARLEAIRGSMLEALGAVGAARHSRLALRIRAAVQVQSLWDLRADLMNAACLQYGESTARGLMKGVDSSFDGAVPAPWKSVRSVPQPNRWMER